MASRERVELSHLGLGIQAPRPAAGISGEWDSNPRSLESESRTFATKLSPGEIQDGRTCTCDLRFPEAVPSLLGHILLARQTGAAPVSSCSTGRCNRWIATGAIGEPGGNRTHPPCYLKGSCPHQEATGPESEVCLHFLDSNWCAQDESNILQAVIGRLHIPTCSRRMVGRCGIEPHPSREPLYRRPARTTGFPSPEPLPGIAPRPSHYQ